MYTLPFEAFQLIICSVSKFVNIFTRHCKELEQQTKTIIMLQGHTVEGCGSLTGRERNFLENNLQRVSNKLMRFSFRST